MRFEQNGLENIVKKRKTGAYRDEQVYVMDQTNTQRKEATIQHNLQRTHFQNKKTILRLTILHFFIYP